LATSSTISERAFATFRVAGDNLVPGQVTEILGTKPTRQHAKGEVYSRGPHTSRPLKGRTGVWLLTTEHAVDSNRLDDHLEWLLTHVAFNQELKRFIAENALHAAVSCFWHGPVGARPPVVPPVAREMIAAIPAELEEDFDTDDESPPGFVLTPVYSR
jgi:hypothetical protein